MKIELRKVSHQNKGAELMLRALVGHFDERPEVELCGRIQLGPRARRQALGIKTLLYASNRGWFATTPPLLPPRLMRERLGLVHPAELDVILDASGFAYGDQWGPDKARQAASYFRYARQRGAKVVLMPQSMGTFEKPAVREAAERLFEQSDLIFPRDATALECVTELCGATSRIIQAPDFTPLVHGEVPRGLGIPERAAAIIPNEKMIAMTGAHSRAYEDFIVEVIEVFRDHGLRPIILRHATADEPLIQRISTRCRVAPPVIRESDALKLKGIIGQCCAALCSRYHGLVSALCQGVPAIATGWSHKYRHLLEEYHCPEALLDIQKDRATLAAAVADFLEPEQLERQRKLLLDRADWHKEQVRAMWARVDELIG